MWRTKMQYGHKWVWGAVIEEGMREGEVIGSNPADHKARDFAHEKCRDLRLKIVW
jgi:hypothetical protein